MKKFFYTCLFVYSLVILVFQLPLSLIAENLPPKKPNTTGKTPLDDNSQKERVQVEKESFLHNLPIYFIPNEGQYHQDVLFFGKTPGYNLWITKEGLVFDSSHKNSSRSSYHKRDVSKLTFLNANKNLRIIPDDKTNHTVNFFLGSRQKDWKTDISTTKSVIYKNIYPGIDVKIYGNSNQIEYDYIIKPGAKVSDILFKYENIHSTSLDKNGNIVIKTELGKLTHSKPTSYQIINGEKTEVKTSFYETNQNTYGFKTQPYQHEHPLIIDPLIEVYSTFLGGSGFDNGEGITVDKDGAVYITGFTESADLPTKKALQKNLSGIRDAYVMKLHPQDYSIIYATYLGGSDNDFAYGIAVDDNGNAYVTGMTQSQDFPTRNAFQKSSGGMGDVFVAKLSANGKKLIYSTYLGGYFYDYGRGIAVDSSGQAHIIGNTSSSDFPVKNALQKKHNGLSDAFVTKLSKTGTTLVYSSFIGGSHSDTGKRITLDSREEAHLVGYTESEDFPTKKAFQSQFGGETDAFIAKVKKTGKLIFSTYLGGEKKDYGYAITTDSNRKVYITGKTSSENFPTKKAFQKKLKDRSDTYITILKRNGKLDESTYIGGSGDDSSYGIAVSPQGVVYISGNSNSLDLPGYSSDSIDNFVGHIYFFSMIMYFARETKKFVYSYLIDKFGDGYITDMFFDMITLAIYLFGHLYTKTPEKETLCDIFFGKYKAEKEKIIP